MANKFEMGSSEYAIPTASDEHYTEAELNDKQEMYGAIEYESLVDPDEYDSSKVEVSDETLDEMRKKREKLDRKLGVSSNRIASLLNRLQLS